MKKSDGSIDAGGGEKHPRENTLASGKNVAEIQRNYLDIKVLVRSLQRTEGREDCFLSGRMDCDETDCRWRSYCLEKLPI
jgi:hypothetical protein